jgi:hypothetical protein
VRAHQFIERAGGTLTRSAVSLALLTVLATWGSPAAAQVSPEEAEAIGVDAYLYFYPLVTMDVTRRQLTNMEPGTGGLGGPPNTFVNIPTYPTADMKVVVRPNFDTLYSSAWLDLTAEPVIVSVPDTNGRYYLLPMLDMWTNVFASPGWRTTGTQAGDFAIVPPGWHLGQSKLPEGVQRIEAPTPYAWIIGRTKTDGPPDYDAVHKIQAGFKITPLSRWGKAPEPVEVKIDPSVDMKTPPKIQVDRMPSAEYFAYAAELMKLQPPHITDQPIIARLQRIGFEPGASFDLDKADPTVQQALERAPAQAQRLMAWKVPTLARVVNGWSMNTDTMGVYGNYYLKRAIVAQLGLGANLPEDAIYPLNIGDEDGRPLDGASNYTIHFDQEALPPVDAFWSITLYDQDGYQVANSLNRFAVSSWMPLEHNPDGSLDLYFQHDSPGTDKEANWLPAPTGPFNLTMRLYAPKSEALTGKWNPPPVTKVQAPSFLETQ